MKVRVFVLMVLCAVGLAACGSTTLDQGDLEAELIRASEDEGLEVESASCPSDVEDEDGTEFECTATLANGGEETVEGVIEVEGDTATPIYTYGTATGATGAEGDQ